MITPASRTAEQLALAQVLDVDVSADTFDVAAARLLDRCARALGYEEPTPSTDRQRAFAESLSIDVSADSKRVASARIGDRMWSRNQEAIVTLDLRPGDRVVHIVSGAVDGEIYSFEREHVVSSIQANGRVFFKGGNGMGAWPTQLRKVDNPEQ